jgi:membrane-bound ClpP family serine protease
MSSLVWILLLLAVGLALILLEVFVPSGGVLGLLAVTALVVGIVMAFLEGGLATGMAVLGGAFVAVPAVLMVAFRWFPSTPLGRRVLPPPPAADDVLPDLADRRRLRELVGRPGRTLGELLPWGRVEVDGQTFEAVSDGRPLAAGAAIEVTAVQGRSLVVRQASEAPSEPDAEALLPAAVEPGAAATPRLSNLLEEFDFDEIRQNSAPADELDSPPSANQA